MIQKDLLPLPPTTAYDYSYTVFGLTIQSTLPLSGLVEASPTDSPDVLVHYGKAVPPKDNKTTYNQNLIYNQTDFYVKVPQGAGAFSVHKRANHTEVIYELWQKEKNQTNMAWFYGIVLSAVLHLNDSFALHASGVLHQDQLHLFCGHSGMGKSTLASALRSKGFPLFTDDKCVLRWSTELECYQASPSLPIVRLWENSVAAIPHEDFLSDPVPVIYKSNKSQFRIRASELIQQSKSVKAIYIITNVPKTETLACVPLKGMNKLIYLRAQIFRVEMAAGFHRKKELWAYLQKLAQNIPINMLLRPLDTSIEDFANFVATEVKNEK